MTTLFHYALCMLYAALLLKEHAILLVQYHQQGLKASLIQCVEGHHVFLYKLSYQTE